MEEKSPPYKGQKTTILTTEGQTVVGYILTAGSADKTNTLTIMRPIEHSEQYEVDIIPISSIKELKVDSKTCLDFSTVVPNIKKPSQDPTAKLEKALEKHKRYLESINENVSPRIQKLFHNLSKQYVCEWAKGNAIFFKEFNMYVRPPYGPKNCEGGSDEKAKARVQHILKEFNAKSE